MLFGLVPVNQLHWGPEYLVPREMSKRIRLTTLR